MNFIGKRSFSVVFLMAVVSLFALAATAQASFVNGGFETGDLSGWTPVTTATNFGIAVFPPTSIANLNLQSGGTARTYARTGATETQIPAGLTAAESLRFPKYDNWSGVVNELGNNFNVNRMKQAVTVTNADVDPVDGKIHVRFAIAPVLQNPGHALNEQPYFYIELRNVTKGTVLFTTFNFANQAGVPWKSNAGGTVQYTDWQAFDIAPGNVALAAGDSIELEVIAAGCAQGGHWGHVYVDGIGSFLPGLIVTKTGPLQANAGTDMTYTFTYQNNGTAPAANVIVDEVIPANTTFVSVNAPGATCTTPAVGGTGTVSCNVGTVNPNGSGTMQVTVHIITGTTGKISNGNYSVRADSITPLIGPLFETTITAATLTDLAVTVTDGLPAVGWGQPITYTIAVTNNGPNDANASTVTDIMPAQLTGVTWNCLGSGGASCTSNGSGDINDTVNLPVGGVVTYTVNAAVIAGSGTGTLINTVAVTTPAGITDSNISNNTAIDTDNIGTLYALTVQKDAAGTGIGNVVSSPVAIDCNTACASATAQFVDGTLISLTASAPTGNYFSGWTGACTGMTNPCVFTISGDISAVAKFDVLTFTITTSPGPNGTISCTPNPVPYNTSSSCAVTPDLGYHVATTGGTCVGALSFTTYTTDAITANCEVTATFAINQYQVTGPAGTNGSLNAATPSPQTVLHGLTTQFTFDADPNYHIAAITDTCGGAGYTNTSNAVTSYSYTTGAITADCSVSATFAINQLGVTTTPEPNGTISCTPNPVPYNTSSSCSVMPNAGYHIVSPGGTCGGTLSVTTYTTNAVTTDCTVTASFAINQYQVTAAASGSGSLNTATPSPQTVSHGSTTQFTFDADPNYYIASITDTCGGPGYISTGSVTSYTYTTGPITSNCSITALLNATPVPVSVPTLNDWGMAVFIALAGMGAVYALRRQTRQTL